ncbi:ABC transporter permease, partial [bacterium]|nr:ABC transporter permease [candidate division CSSED10-310 bacterium]
FVAQWTGAINEPLLVRTEVETATRRETPPSGMDQQLPGNIVMFVVMTLLVNSAVHLTSERKNGAFRRLMASPLTPGRILAGKLLGRIVPATVQVALLFLTGRILFGVHIGSALPGIILLSGAFILCAAAMGLTMGMWMDDRNHVVAAGVPLTLGMAALGGCWWPIEIVGPFMQRLGMTLPTGWAMRGYHELLSFGYGITAVLDNSALLIAAAFVFTAIAARRIRPVR